MASEPCSRCGEKIRGKTAGAYVSWYPDREHRICYKTDLCPDCTVELYVPLITRPVEDLDLCPACGGRLGQDVAKTFLTLYVPHKDQYDDRFDTCEVCAVPFRERLSLGGKPQPDRGVEVRGPSPSQQAWAAIPI